MVVQVGRVRTGGIEQRLDFLDKAAVGARNGPQIIGLGLQEAAEGRVGGQQLGQGVGHGGGRSTQEHQVFVPVDEVAVGQNQLTDGPEGPISLLDDGQYRLAQDVGIGFQIGGIRHKANQAVDQENIILIMYYLAHCPIVHRVPVAVKSSRAFRPGAAFLLLDIGLSFVILLRAL